MQVVAVLMHERHGDEHNMQVLSDGIVLPIVVRYEPVGHCV